MLAFVLRGCLAVLYSAATILTFVALTDDRSEAAPASVEYQTAAIEALARPALAAIDYDWERRLPGWRIEFVAGEGSIAGYTWSQERRIEVFVRDGATSADLARILGHELGHAVDVSMNSAADRQTWQQARGIGDAPWWPSDGAADFATGAGDFAEAFAAWQVGETDYRGELAPAPTPEHLLLLVELAEG